MTLDQWLREARAGAGLSVEEVCNRTKIQARFVKALESGDLAALPSNTHLRAFALALAGACGADEARAAELVRQTLDAVALPQAALPPLRSSQPASPSTKIIARSPGLAAEASPAGGLPALATSNGGSPDLGALGRLRSVPWQALAGLSGTAALLLAGLLWATTALRERASVSEPVAAATAVLSQAVRGAELKVASPSENAPPAVAGSAELVLRARRPCWLVLEIDGKRLPTITLQDGDKRYWQVSKRAVLLAGNLGALRVWWMGENLGYLGELGQRANGLMFEPGKIWRLDRSAGLPLPAGVPE